MIMIVYKLFTFTHLYSFVVIVMFDGMILDIYIVQPSTRAIKLGNNSPVIKGAFVASTASVIGKVEIGSSSSVWYGAVVRGKSTYDG